MPAQRRKGGQASSGAEAVRRDLITACRILEAEGLVTGYGHVSAPPAGAGP